ncbi:MAG: S1 RNA-binding domain-containing protein, partial [Gammaproteobacteria bacterium]
RERISLGIKQLEQDPFQNYLAVHEKGSIVKGTVKEVDAKGATITLADNVDGYIRAAEIQRDRVEDVRSHLKEGDEVDAKFIGIDKKNKTITLSIKAMDYDQESAAIKDYAKKTASAPTLGDLFKEMEEK